MHDWFAWGHARLAGSGLHGHALGFQWTGNEVETPLRQDPCSGHVFVFRGGRDDLIQVLWWTGDGLCLLCKRLERGRFVWLQVAEGTVLDACPIINAAQGDRLALAGVHLPPVKNSTPPRRRIVLPGNQARGV